MWKRSASVKPCGIGDCWSHLLRSSATTFWAPGMWLTSISMPVDPDNKQSFSKNTQKGYDMLHKRLLPLSAPVLSLNVFKHKGNLWAGKTLDAMKRSAICANASKQVICRWSSCDTWRPNCSKSDTPNCSENHIRLLFNFKKPPIWHVALAAHASAAHSPFQYLFGDKGLIGDKAWSQDSKSPRIRSDASEMCLRLDCGSRILIQMRLSESLRAWRSDRLETDWCRTERRVPPIGIAVPFGLCRNVMSSLRLETRKCQSP